MNSLLFQLFELKTAFCSPPSTFIVRSLAFCVFAFVCGRVCVSFFFLCLYWAAFVHFKYSILSCFFSSSIHVCFCLYLSLYVWVSTPSTQSCVVCVSLLNSHGWGPPLDLHESQDILIRALPRTLMNSGSSRAKKKKKGRKKSTSCQSKSPSGFFILI